MDLITTHLNADFDGLASMIATLKLYPGAILAFPGSQEKNVRTYISEQLDATYPFRRLKQIDFTTINRLIVVDTRVTSRLGPIQSCLTNPNLVIHLYDHHPNSPEDLKGEIEVVEDTGSTMTILCRQLREQQIPITADEATLFGLGIYEDTGSLTHLTTTPADLEAAAWLLHKGARLDIVTQFISHDLTSLQIELLHELKKTASCYTIQGIEVVLVTLTLPDYVDDFSLIIRQFMAMENLNTLFALICMAGRIYLICRSRIPEVHVGQIARELGGGGHSTAASATVQNMTLVEAQERLIRILHQEIHPHSIAREIMSQPVISASANITIDEAHTLLTRYNITVLPVISTEHDNTTSTPPAASELLGTISRRVVEKAIHHNLGQLQIQEYMTGDIEALPADATLSDIEKLIIDRRQRLVPIIDKNELTGIITRTDLLNVLVNDPGHLPRDLHHESEIQPLQRSRNTSSLMTECLNRELTVLLKTIGEIADRLNFKAFAVGGFVRDLLLKQKNLDLDIVIEGNGIAFAKELAKALNGRCKAHEQFITAVVILPDGFKIDVATARLEYYEYPAALPTVELSSIKLDLYRRDFTINAMAIQLNAEQFGTLIDFFSCQNDLKSGIIRVLHNLSFVEDPTRIFRAIRFEQRMELSISKHTHRLIRSAVKMNLFDKGNDPRFFNELQQILSEDNPLPALTRLAEFDLFKFLWPELKPHLKIDRRFLHIMKQAQQALSWYDLLYLDTPCRRWLVYLLSIMARSGTDDLTSFCQRFHLHEKIRQQLISQKALADHTGQVLYQRNEIRNSELYRLLRGLTNEGLLYLMAIARKNEIKKNISNFVTSLRQTEILLTGNDLKEMGYLPGPLYKTILDRLLDARLDGQVSTLDDERQYVLDHFPLIS
ncbi:CBS domain-containing protein [Methanococcoides sp. SA1]|nr:CBS domain-containing protein [Methanococcoides sp. SA1]